MKAKILILGLILLNISSVLATNLVVEEGDVTLLINNHHIQLEKDQTITLSAGVMVCFIEGKGKVIINHKKELNSKTPDCYQTPLQKDFSIEDFISISESSVVLSVKNGKDKNGMNRGFTTLPSSETKEIISISSSDKEVVIYDETYGPLPITLSIKKPDGTIYKEIINEDNPKTFFRIPTTYLESDSGIEVTNAFGDTLLDKKVSVSNYFAYAPHDQVFYEKGEHTLVDILYGTDRKKSYKLNNFENYYTGERGKLKFGVAQVSVPKIHEFGKMERPINSDQPGIKGEHIVISKLEDIGQKDFLKFLQNKLGNVKEKDILIFIHGYNVSFASAIRRTAQLSYDLDFKGVPMAYSWPSQGNTSKYFKDESSIQYTVPHLVSFLQEIIDNKKEANIHLLGHSMGTRALSNALKEISYIYEGKHVFKNVILAASDVDKDVFEVGIFPYIRRTTEKVTLYANSNDKALMASNEIHGGDRIGQGGDNIFVFEGLDSIDATGVDTSFLSFFNLNHSYFAEKEVLINDLKAVIDKSLPPSKRESLIQKIKTKLAYWKFKFEN